MKILLLEDDGLLAESLSEYLRMEGYEVDRVARGEAVFDATFEKRYDLYLLDINVPDINGLEVLKALGEAEDRTPTIYITALTDLETMAKGFDLGAVDYLKKPFDPEELLLRIRRLFKGREEEGMLRYGNMRFDPESGRVEGVGDSPIHLGVVQRRLLEMLIRRQGSVVPAGELMEALEHPSANALRVTLAKLKKRLGIDIVNVRGEGYMLETV